MLQGLKGHGGSGGNGEDVFSNLVVSRDGGPQTCQLMLFSTDTAVSVEQKISSFEKILRRDLKLMRHRQVIHPVLQEGRNVVCSSSLAHSACLCCRK